MKYLRKRSSIIKVNEGNVGEKVKKFLNFDKDKELSEYFPLIEEHLYNILDAVWDINNSIGIYARVHRSSRTVNGVLRGEIKDFENNYYNRYSFIVKQDNKYKFDIAIFLKKYKEYGNMVSCRIEEHEKTQFFDFCLKLFLAQHKIELNRFKRWQEMGYDAQGFGVDTDSVFVKPPEISTFDVMKDINEAHMMILPEQESDMNKFKYEVMLHTISQLFRNIIDLNNIIIEEPWLQEEGEDREDLQIHYGSKFLEFENEWGKTFITKDDSGHYKFDIMEFLKNPVLKGIDYSDVMNNEDMLKRFMEYFNMKREIEDFESPFLIDPYIDINQIFKQINEE